jgi:hypothetical protein
MPVRKEIIYPIFLECCQYTEDTFWEDLFEDLSYGRTPYGAYISRDFICCNFRNKEFSYKIERKDPKSVYDDIYKLFTNKLGILSQREKQKRKLDFETLENNICKNATNQKWSTINKTNQEILLEKYIIEKTEEHNLGIKEAQKLFKIIKVADELKIINLSRGVQLCDNKIVDIDGVDVLHPELLQYRKIKGDNEEDDEEEDENEENEEKDENEEDDEKEKEDYKYHQIPKKITEDKKLKLAWKKFLSTLKGNREQIT